MTVSDRAQPCPQDLVNRQFKASRSNALWVSDFTPAFAGAGSMFRLGKASCTWRS